MMEKIKGLFLSLLVMLAIFTDSVFAGNGAIGDLYVVGRYSYGIHQYDIATGVEYGSPFAGGLGGKINSATQAIFSPHNGNLLVGTETSGPWPSKVAEYDGWTGAYVKDFVLSASGGLNKVMGMLFSPHTGNLLLSSANTSQVLEYDGYTGGYIGVFISAANFSGTPRGMRIGLDGNLYICDGTNNTVKVFNASTGAFIKQFFISGSGGLSGPYDLEFGGPSNSMFVTDNVGHIIEYNGSTGGYIRTINSPSACWLGGIAIGGPNDLIYVSAGTTNKVEKYNSSTGAFIGDFVASDGVLPRLKTPQGLIFKPVPEPVCGDADHPYPAGDLNYDCIVNFYDLSLFAQNWMTEVVLDHGICAIPGGYNHDFKDDLNGWLVSGDAWHATSGSQKLLPWNGVRYASSDDGTATGSVRSANFTLATADRLSFYIAGYDGSGLTPGTLNWVRLVRASDTVTLFEQRCPQQADWKFIVWDITPYIGTEVYIEVVDTNTDSTYGWIAVDDFEAGLDEILPPWTPVTVSDANVNCWGRQYQWSSLPFPKQVVTQGQQILAGPIRVKAVVGGSQVSWSPYGTNNPAELTSSTGAAAYIKRTVTGSGLKLEGTAITEYDGMMRIDFSLAAQTSPVTVTSLIVEIPYKPERATLFHFWPMDDGTYFSSSGAVIGSTVTGKFKPFWWLGNENGGLCWFSESDKNWMPIASSSAIQIVPSGGEVVLRLNLWTNDRTISAAPETFTMGLEATPVKLWPTNYHRQHISGNAWYGCELPANSWWLNDYKNKGVDVMCVGQDWAKIQNYDRAWYPNQFKQIVDLVQNTYNMAIVPYFGFEISDIAPEWSKYNQECRGLPSGHYTDRTDAPQRAYLVCYRSRWADFIADGINKTKEQYGIDGVYLDATCRPEPCSNAAHNCGYTVSGTSYPSYAIFAYRSLMKRIWTTFADEPKGIVIGHTSGSTLVPTVGFASWYMTAEHMANMTPKPHPLEVLPLAAFRAELMGRNWGIPSLVINPDNVTMNTKQLLSISLIHDVIPRSTWNPSGNLILFPYWTIFEDYGADFAEFFPYWSNSSYVTVSSPSDIYVSFMRRLDAESVLLMVSNLGYSDLTNAWVDIDYPALDLPVLDNCTATVWRYGMGTTGEDIAVSNGRITFSTLPMCSPVIIQIPKMP